MKIALMHKHRKRARNLQKHEMSFTYEAFACLGKRENGKRELRAIFKQVFKTFQENNRNLLNM